MTSCSGIAHTLKAREISTAFGLPGIHNLDIYSAFHEAGFELITVRHEQSASFMADGYARATGRTAACLLIDGPGFLNAATGIAQARADSIPMVVVTPGIGERQALGRAHELCGQGEISRVLCRDHFIVNEETQLCDIAKFLDCNRGSLRPGPLHIEVPMSLSKCSEDDQLHPPVVDRSHEPPVGDFASAIQLLEESQLPVIIVGGGAVGAAQEIRSLAELLDAPVVNTVNAKGILPANHPLRVGFSPSLPEIRQLLTDADVVLAVGTELGETDFDLLMLDEPLRFRKLIRVDIDPKQVHANAKSCCSIVGDAKAAIAKLMVKKQSCSGTSGVCRVRVEASRSKYCNSEMGVFLDTIRDETDVLVGDSTQPTYYAAWMYEPNDIRQYFHSVSGFGTLGYAIPAAIGAKIGKPESRVTCLIGDGGAQFTLSEIRTASQLQMGLPIVIWNNNGYLEIDKAMEVQSAKPSYESPKPPDFRLIAQAHGACYSRPQDIVELGAAVRVAHVSNRPTLIEVDQSQFFEYELTENWYQ